MYVILGKMGNNFKCALNHKIGQGGVKSVLGWAVHFEFNLPSKYYENPFNVMLSFQIIETHRRHKNTMHTQY